MNQNTLTFGDLHQLILMNCLSVEPTTTISSPVLNDLQCRRLNVDGDFNKISFMLEQSIEPPCWMGIGRECDGRKDGVFFSPACLFCFWPTNLGAIYFSPQSSPASEIQEGG